MAAKRDDRIHLEAAPVRVRVSAGEVLLADSRDAITLHERGYPTRWYLPHADIAPDRLSPSATRTHCPHKGEAQYYHLQLPGGETLEDAAWVYRQPIEAVAAIAGRVAFDHPQLRLHVESA